MGLVKWGLETEKLSAGHRRAIGCGVCAQAWAVPGRPLSAAPDPFRHPVSVTLSLVLSILGSSCAIEPFPRHWP